MTTPKLKLLAHSDILGLWRKVVHGQSVVAQGAQSEETSGCTHKKDETGPCCRRHAVVLPGYGKRDYPFPTPDELLASSIALWNALQREHQSAGLQLEIGGDEQTEPEAEETPRPRTGQKRSPRLIALGKGPLHTRRSRNRQWFDDDAWQRARARVAKEKSDEAAQPVSKLISDIGGKTTSPTNGPVLRIAAGTLAHFMHEGRDKAAIARQFDPLRGAVNWALTEMPAKYRPAKYRDTAASLKDQLARLVDVYRQVLPQFVQFLGAQYPKASEEELLEVAVSILNEQLSEILTVLSIWTDSFAQRRDGMYTQLEYVHFTVEQALRLFQTGDASAREEKGIKTHAFHVGDVFMARFSDQGPATIPGGRGPVGAHAIEVPFDEQDVIVLYTPLYTHEFRHDYYSDVDGLPESLTEAVVNAIQQAAKDGKFKFSSEKIMLGKQAVPTLSLITQVMAQTLGETDADIAGGVSLTGEAYGYSMLATFSAFNIRGQNPVAVNRMLRHSSVYAVGPQGELAIEPHLPDYIRVYTVAAALEKMGFAAEADEFRRLADQASGIPQPTHILWHNIDPDSKYKFEIKIPMDDLKQVVPVVVDAILNAPLPALNGLSTSQMVNWTPKRQEKVDALVQALIQGSSTIPWEMGDFWATYVAAAVTKAAWTLWKSGTLPPVIATAVVEENGRKMMDQVKERFEQMEAEAEASRPVAEEPVTKPTTDPAHESDATESGDTAEEDGDLEDGDEEGSAVGASDEEATEGEDTSGDAHTTGKDKGNAPKS
jgi:hypothetical protein